MPRNPTSRTPLLRLSGMRRADAPGLGRTNPEVRRNVSRLRRLLTPKISRRRQPTEALMMMITEECHPEEMQAFATRRPADEGPTHYSSRRLARTVAFILLTRVPRPSSLGPLALPQRTRKGWGTLIGTAPLKAKERLEWATRLRITHREGSPGLSRSFYSRGCPVQARLGHWPFRKERGKDGAP